ncbi:MAG: cyclic nucleotide-binding domain-containing protein [Devosiaceae bacterium]|nr:cyclic nucleotide-binding domain-containing protein [Devosiaceae bacterium MH13]
MSTVAEGASLLGWHGWAGLVGVFLYVFAYAALQLGHLKAETYTFSALNALAGICVLLGLTPAFNVYSAAIQLLWITLSVIGFTRVFLMRRKVHFSADELAFVTTALPSLPRAAARTLLDRSQVLDIEPGVVLTEQGDEITHLVYILSGDADVAADGHDIATLGQGAYIGDVTYQEPEPASATVTARSAMRALTFDVASLRPFLAERADIRTALEASATNNLRAKLRAANARAIVEATQGANRTAQAQQQTAATRQPQTAATQPSHRGAQRAPLPPVPPVPGRDAPLPGRAPSHGLTRPADPVPPPPPPLTPGAVRRRLLELS